MIYFWFSSQDWWLLWMPARRKIADGGGVVESSHESKHEACSVRKTCEICVKSDRTTAPEWITNFRRGPKAAWVSTRPPACALSAIKSPEKGRHSKPSIEGVPGSLLRLPPFGWRLTSLWHRVPECTGVKVLDEALNLICALRTTGCFNSRNVHLCSAGAV